ncbi:hypothetical protein CNMCM5878_003575 [Aspergillus fumigatiaffinis]|nr:hypothetical protein CNMCM5878_003575 [Aspergillus fumigatiaffinis]KAF4237970.1 hypothetical protein CNMCM6457_000447 [Aspergillus fumigatiaffinis]
MGQYWLPLEIISLVISYLDVSTNSSLIPYATVSREWQACIEQRTFAILKLNTPQRLKEFSQVVASNKQRQKYVQEIHLIIQLQPCNIRARAYMETAAEHSHNNKLFVRTIQDILRILATWPEKLRGIELLIQAQSPIYATRRERARREAGRDTPEEDQLDLRFERSYLHVSEESLKKIPPVMAVTTLTIYGGSRYERLIRPSATAVIASKMPRLQNVVLNLRDNEKRDQDLRKRNRAEFANTFHLLPPSVQRFDLVFYNETSGCETFDLIDLVQGKVEDLLSAQLRDFSQQLTSLSLQYAVIGKELFWPVNTAENTQLPFWPNLTTFRLEYRGTSPSGERYFEIGPIEEVEDGGAVRPLREIRHPRYRAKAAVELIRELYISAGRAAQRMPRLQCMDLKCFSSLVSHGFVYEVKGKAATATWTDPAAYVPDEGVVNVWRDAAFQHTGVESSLEVELIDRTGAI